jgi:hypothetical protein
MDEDAAQPVEAAKSMRVRFRGHTVRRIAYERRMLGCEPDVFWPNAIIVSPQRTQQILQQIGLSLTNVQEGIQLFA